MVRSEQGYYRKPSAKAPVIHPGEEAPFLFGEVSALRCLTEGSRPAMIGIDVLYGEKSEADG
jgi:hypothetical protein